MVKAASATADIQISVRRHYDALFWPYRLFWGGHLHHGLFRTGHESPREAQLAMLRYCVAMLPARPQGRVLDVGCGYGGTSLFLAREFGCRVHGVSLSSRQIAYANAKARRERMSDRVTFSVADADALELAPETYDLIWVMESSEHFMDRRGFFARAASSLRRGGMLLLAAWTAGEDAEKAEVQRVATASVCPSFSTIGEYRTMLSDAGLTVHSCEELTGSVLRTWEVVRSRVGRVRLFARLTPAPVREFSSAIDEIDSAFRSRLLQYHVCVAMRD